MPGRKDIFKLAQHILDPHKHSVDEFTNILKKYDFLYNGETIMDTREIEIQEKKLCPYCQIFHDAPSDAMWIPTCIGCNKEHFRRRNVCQCDDCRDMLATRGLVHTSDCAVHNEPAESKGKCTCGGAFVDG